MATNSADKSAQASAQARNKDVGTADKGGAWAIAKQAETGQLAPRAERTDWGVTGVKIGTWTPWGTVDYVVESAPGIARFGTPGHGGVKLSAARNRLVHPALRRPKGLYEEDTESFIVDFTFPEETLPLVSRGYSIDYDLDEHIENATKGLRNWYPNEYEEVTGETILPGESHLRDEQMWAEAHKDRFVVSSALRDPEDHTQVLVTARRGNENKDFRISAAEYNTRRTGGGGRFAIDESRHEEIVKAPAPVAAAVEPAKLEPNATAEQINHLFGKN